MKKITINIFLLFVSLSLAVVGTEVIARIFFSYQDKVLREKRSRNILTQVAKHELFTRIEPGGFANRPNAQVHWWGFDIRTDSLGCRIGPAAPESSAVILFIGDSMTFGLGLPDSASIPGLLQARLIQAAPDHPVRVVNASVIGYDFRLYLHQLRRLTPILKPELIIVGICYNDLFPNEDPYQNIMADRGFAEAKSSAPKAQFAGSNSSIAGQIKKLLRDTALYSLWQKSGIGARLSGGSGEYTEPAVLASLNQAPELVEEFIAALHEYNVPYLFVYFPTPDRLGSPSDFVYVRILQERGEPVLDLSLSDGLSQESYFLRESRGRLQPDIHFNLPGGQVVADEISRWLTDQKYWN
jgi:hypothetical protein